MPEESASAQIVKSTAISIVRHFLSIGAAYLISKGLVAPEILSESNLLILAGGVVAGTISLGLIIRQKLKTRNLVQAARETPAGTSMEQIKDIANAKPLTGN
jgi:hypothetical protein